MQDEFYKKLDKFIDIVNQVNMDFEKKHTLSQSLKIINAPVDNESTESVHHDNINNAFVTNLPDNSKIVKNEITINDNQSIDAVYENKDIKTFENKAENLDTIKINDTSVDNIIHEKITNVAVKKMPLKSETEKIIDNNNGNKSIVSDQDNENITAVNSNREHIINSTKKAIDRLMIYAVKNSMLKLDNDFLTKIVPALRKDSKDFTVEDEIILWTSYHELAQLVKPATDFSILIAHKLNGEVKAIDNSNPQSRAEAFKFWKQPKSNLCISVNKCVIQLGFIVLGLILSIIFYISIQSYCGALSTALTGSNNVFKEWQTQQSLIAQQKTDGSNEPGINKFNLMLLDNQYAASLQVLNQVLRLARVFMPYEHENFTTLSCQDLMKHSGEPAYLTTCHTFQKNYANIVYTILTQYVLPLILGIVGSTAYIARSVLEQLQNNSYLPAVQGKITMRIFLGGLLGAITGIFISSSNSGTLQKFDLNMVMLSLIMGYSVDVAFSLFDRIVERLSDWTNALKTQNRKDIEK